MAVKEINLLCIGNALVDVFIREEEILPQSTHVQHVEMEKLTGILGALSDSRSAAIGSGGGAANTAKIAGLLGEKVCFTGAIGQNSNKSARPDKYGQIFTEDLAAAGVELKLILKPRPTGVCLYIKTGEETRIAAAPSAALDFSESDISADEIRRAGIVLIDGFMLGRQNLVRRILNLAGSEGAVAAMDLGSAAIAFEHAAEIAAYIKQYPMIISMNEEEAKALYRGIKNKEGCVTDINMLFSSITSGGIFPIITVTHGPEGASCFSRGIMDRASAQAIIPTESTGAGNAFFAAFLCAWTRNKPLRDCADFGNRTARLVLNTAGTQVDGNDFNDLAGELKKK